MIQHGQVPRWASGGRESDAARSPGCTGLAEMLAGADIAAAASLGTNLVQMALCGLQAAPNCQTYSKHQISTYRPASEPGVAPVPPWIVNCVTTWTQFRPRLDGRDVRQNFGLRAHMRGSFSAHVRVSKRCLGLFPTAAGHELDALRAGETLTLSLAQFHRPA